MDLSIIIINYKSKDLILDCLQSIYGQTHQYSFEIIIVDNDSKDDCKESVLIKYQDVRWLQMEYNAGFARANNAAIRIASGRYILLLNADTIILDNAINKSIALMEIHQDAAACGVQLLNPDKSNQISGALNSIGGLNTLLTLPYLGNLIRYLGYKLKSTVPSIKDIRDKVEVDWIVGAYILVRKSVLSKSGLLDEDFFMYIEELEWCGRLKKQGKLYLFPGPKVIHLLGGTSNDYYKTTEKQNSKNIWNAKGRQIMISNLLRTRKQFGIGWYLLVFSIYMFEVPAFFFCLLFDKIFTRKNNYSWASLGAYTKNTGVILKYFFQILLNKHRFYKIS